jgi:hypothetical protein
MAGVHGMFLGSASRKIINIIISANTQNYVLNTAKATGYVAGSSDITLTINPGVVIGSASTGSYAFTVDTSWNASDKVTIVNNGIISAAGGAGGPGATATTKYVQGGAGSAGGYALGVQRPIILNNFGELSGGGGGGGGGGATGSTNSPTNGAAGNGGSGGGAGGGGVYGQAAGSTGAGGGAFDGGSGGARGSSGATGGGSNYGGAGGAPGYYIVGGSNVTWISTGTRLGYAA